MLAVCSVRPCRLADRRPSVVSTDASRHSYVICAPINLTIHTCRCFVAPAGEHTPSVNRLQLAADHCGSISNMQHALMPRLLAVRTPGQSLADSGHVS
jgi:hypothetical protein